jgi:hypothetical protein
MDDTQWAQGLKLSNLQNKQKKTIEDYFCNSPDARSCGDILLDATLVL